MVYLLNHKTFGHDALPTNRYSHRHYFRGGPKSGSFLIYQPNVINQKPIMMGLWYFSYLNLCTKTIKNSKYHILPIKTLHYFAISSRS